MDSNVVYRDELGNIIDRDLWYKKKIIGRKKFKRTESDRNKFKEDPEFTKYKSGVVQFEEIKRNAEKFESLANDEVIDGGRYYISKSYDDELRKKDIWDDPIKYIDLSSDSLGDSNLKSRFVDLKARRLKCKFITDQNRFSIESGYRWDGVIRGNGFEEKYLNEKYMKNNTQHFID
ncbi:hypothetical protein OIY81_1036 [Cryptosporidium canis]|nr:hypothetical protein OIY81_1036 [Cryptosporidium canis]